MEPTKSRVRILIFIVVAIVALALYLRYEGLSSDWLLKVSQEGKWLLPLVAVSAVIDSLNPCAFSVLLLTIAFLFSIGRLRTGILKIGFVYIFGVFLIYLLIGLGFIKTLSFFNIPHFMARLAASLLIILGMINIINEFFPKFPIKLRIPARAHHRMADYMEKASLPAAFFLGIFIGLTEFPCTGGPYLLVLGLLHDQATFLRGFAYLIFYNLIFILPLVIILLVAGDNQMLARVQAWQQKERAAMRFWVGVAMIVLGVLIFLL